MSISILPQLPLEEVDSPSDLTEEETPRLIEEGERNSYLTSVAGVMRRNGLSFEAIKAGLLVHNKEKLRAPLPVSEVETIAWSISKKPAAEPNAPKIMSHIADPEFGEIYPDEICLFASYTDQGNALAFATLYAGKFVHDHTQKKWMAWSESQGKWKLDTNGAVNRAMAVTLQMRYAMTSNIEDDGERARARITLRRAENGRAMTNALEKAASFLSMATNTEDFDTNPYIFNGGSALLDLRREAILSGEIVLPQSSHYRISKVAGARYDAEAEAPRWKQFIHEIFGGNEELMTYVQRVLGLCLSGDISEQAFYVAFGRGSNGKSLLLGTVVKALGDYAEVTPFTTFDASNRNQMGNDLAMLHGARLVVAIEAEGDKQIAQARVKSVTGSDPITCRFMYGEYFTYRPQFKPWIAVNHKPHIRGSDDGIWRRIRIIPFDQKFEEGKNRDKELEAQLEEELPGILNWLLDGYRDYVLNGIRTPEIVLAKTREYREESDALGQWIEEYVTYEEGAVAEVSAAYDHFRWWSRVVRQDDYHISIKTFSQNLEGREAPELAAGVIVKDKATSRADGVTGEVDGIPKNRVIFRGIKVPPAPQLPFGKG